MTSTTRRPLKVGVILPDTEHQMNGGSARWSDLAAMARTAERVGFDSVWVTDHLIHRSDPTESSAESGGDRRELEGPWECWSLLSGLAAITDRVEIGPLVICNSFRNPALLAKMTDTVDEISAGRFILGLGAGWNKSEYDAFGFPFDHRVDRFEEGIQIITALLRTGNVDFHGTYYSAESCELRPRGPRENGPPIMFGTTGERMLGLTARYADSWNTWFNQFQNDPAQIGALLQRVDDACEKENRDPATLDRTAAVKVEIGPHAPSQMSEAPLTGGPAALAEQLNQFAEAGISHVQLWIEPNTVEGIEAFGEVLEQLDQT